MHHYEEMRQIAYRIWEEEGHPDGRDWEHWFKAEAIWHERYGQMERIIFTRTDLVVSKPGERALRRQT